MASTFTVSTKQAAPLDADTGSTPENKQVEQPVFITTQSLNTFAGGSIAITVLWKVANAIFGVQGHWFPGVIAALFAILFFWQAYDAGNLNKGSAILGAAIVALVNASVLWAAAAGIDLGLENTDISTTATTD